MTQPPASDKAKGGPVHGPRPFQLEADDFPLSGPVESPTCQCGHEEAQHEGYGCRSRPGCSCTGYDAPSRPVESREQPSGQLVESRMEKWTRHMGWAHRARTAIILADQEQAAALATIRELRAEAARLTEEKRVFADHWNYWERAEERRAVERDAALAERDRARSLAAGLEEDGAALHRMNDMLANTLRSALTIMRGINMDTPEDQELHERAIDTLAGAFDLKAALDPCPSLLI